MYIIIIFYVYVMFCTLIANIQNMFVEQHSHKHTTHTQSAYCHNILDKQSHLNNE